MFIRTRLRGLRFSPVEIHVITLMDLGPGAFTVRNRDSLHTLSVLQSVRRLVDSIRRIGKKLALRVTPGG
jgi:hypothetical protein